MKTKLLQKEPERTFVVVFDKGDDVIPNLLAFARDEKLDASHFTGIGAFSDVIVGYFDIERRDYRRISIPEQVEVLSLIGNIAIHQDKPKIHIHVVLGKCDGTAHGGHLLEAHVRPTLELVVIESPAHLRRTIDEETGLPLITL